MTAHRRQVLAALSGTAVVTACPLLFAQAPGQLRQPIYRVANNNNLPVNADASQPLQKALQMAREGLEYIRAEIDDYTATVVKRERVEGVLGQHEYLFVKVRNRKIRDGQVVVPFSVYLTYLKPADKAGREVIYVENQNGGNMIAHEGGFKGRFLPTVEIAPTGMLAMRGNRHPITQLGVENLIVQLLQRGQQHIGDTNSEVVFREGAKINGRACTVIELRHPKRQPPAESHLAQVFIDEELNLPVRYAAYDWPAQEGAQGEVIEEYTYFNVKTNVGLTNNDFDRNNSAYNF